MSFSPSPHDLRRAVDAHLGAFLNEKRGLLPDGAPLIDEMTRMLGAGGKRLRPSFCVWGYRAAGGRQDGRIIAAAASLELLHTFALVHDDIMDVSDERRGLPTTFAQHGVNVALLAGDLALVLADACLMESGSDAGALGRAFVAYSRMRQEVIVGQYLDVKAGERQVISVEEARRIAVLKSGRYSVEEPLLIGAALAGADDDFTIRLQAFGAPLGEAFQLRDDLLGSFGDRSSVGKPVDSDIREGKRNVLFAHAAASLDGDDASFFLDRWGGGPALRPEEVERLRRLLVSSGAQTMTESLLADRCDEAAQALSGLDVADDAREALVDLMERATQREM